jgi:hypothetical protein
MKTSIIKTPLKFIIKKRVILINSLIFAIIIFFMAPSCIEEDYPVRLVFPVLTTTPATGITSTGAQSGGDITSDGGKEITARGVCWTITVDNPSIAHLDSITVDGTGIGQFTSAINGLLPDTTYRVRAYATNPDGTAYGQVIIVNTAAK